MSGRRRQRLKNRDKALVRLALIERLAREGKSSKVNDGLSARLCYRNSLHLYRGGLILAQKGEFGSARSLQILSVEELAKAVAYQMIYLGAFGTRRGARGHLIWFDRRCFKCHVCKHELVFRLKVGMDAAKMLGKMQSVQGLFRTAKTPEEAVAAVPEEMAKLTSPQAKAEIASEITSHPETWTELARLFAVASDMEHAKQAGFYVEGWERPPTTPQQVKSEDFERVRIFVEARLSEFFPLLANEVPKEWRRLTKSMVTKVAEAMATADRNFRPREIMCSHSKHQLPR